MDNLIGQLVIVIAVVLIVPVRTCKSFPLKLQNLEISNCKTLKSIQTENCKSSSFKLQNLV